MNRKERRAARKRVKTTMIDPRKVDETCDIQVDGKGRQIVMIFANAKGRKIVQDVWPDVEWTTDEIFSSVHSPEWLFTHILITKLPPHLEQATPLAFASADALGAAVAMTLQRRAEPLRVISYSGEPSNLRANKFSGTALAVAGGDVALFAEYVPAGVWIDPDRKPPRQH